MAFIGGITSTIDKIGTDRIPFVTRRLGRAAFSTGTRRHEPIERQLAERTPDLALPLKGLHHISVLTKHLDESRAFYCDLLGFREIPRPPFSFGGAWLWNYGLQIHLIVDDTIRDPAGPIQTRAHHIALESPDVEAAEQMLSERGIPFRINIQAGSGLKQLFFRDPDGHHIEVASYGPTVE